MAKEEKVEIIEETKDNIREYSSEQELPIYIQRNDCTEEEINALIRLGYTPWQVTPVTENVYKSATLLTSNTKLVYHFIRRKS